MLNKIVRLLSSTKVALILLVLVSVACVLGVILPRSVGKEVIFTSPLFNLLLILLIINIVFCITKRTRFLRLSQAGTTIFHLGLVALFVGVVYDQLFFFEGTIRLTEGETLSCAERVSYDRVRMGRFFQIRKLRELGELYFHKIHIPYIEEGKDRGVANEIALGENVQNGGKRIIYVTSPLKYKGFEFYRVDQDGYSPLFVLRDRQGKVLYGAYVPLQSIEQQDGTYLYRSGTAEAPESFNFPQEPELPKVFRLQTVYYPDKAKRTTGEVSFQVWGVRPHARKSSGESRELFKGKAAFGERVRAGDYFLSMDEVRYWTSMNVVYRPGLNIIFGSFWIIFGGLILNLVLKTMKSRNKGEMVKMEKRDKEKPFLLKPIKD